MLKRVLLGLFGLLLVPASEAIAVPFLESAHPYTSNLDDTQTCTVPGSPATIQVTFWPQTKTEQNYDFIYIFDGANNPVGNPAGYSGTALAGVTLQVPGDTVKIQHTSDGSVEYYGYRATIGATLPYPYLIDSYPGGNSLRPLSQPSSRGPWVYGSNVYTVVENQNPATDILSIWKSADWGQTWAGVDEGNARPSSGWAYISSVTRRGNSLYLLYFPATHPHNAAIAVFDLTSGPAGAWVASDLATGGPSPHTSIMGRTSLISRSDGSFVLVAEVQTGANRNVQYATWSSGAGWSALANVTSLYPNETRLRGGAFLGANDRVHIPLICGPTEMYYDLVISTLTLAGALSDTDTGITVGYELGQYGYVTRAKTYVVGGVTWFALPMNRTVGGAYQQPTHMLRGISADTITEYWEEHVGVDPVPSPAQTNFLHSVMVSLAGKLYALYARMETSDYVSYATFFVARYSGTGAEKYDNSAGWVDDVAVYAWLPGDYPSEPEIGEVNGKIGLVYTLGFDHPWFGLWDKPGPPEIAAGCRYHGF